MVLCTKTLCGKACVGQLTIPRHIEANRERFDRLIRQLTHNTSDNAGIYASTEECSYRHISYHTFLDRPMNVLPYSLGIPFDGKMLSLAESVIPVTLFVHFLILEK